MQSIINFREGEHIVLCTPKVAGDRRLLYASLGIFEGAQATVFLISGKKVILDVGGSKFALSEGATRELSAKKA